MRRQDVIEVLDGRGGIYQAKIVDDDARACEIKIVSSKMHSKAGYQITLAVSPTKNLDRMEWMVEKTAELGINRIIPITCQHSERRTLKTDRLKKKALGALKQSRNPFLTQIDELTSFEDLISTPETEVSKFIAHSSGESHLFQRAKPDLNYLVLIGPEGGFSDNEIDQAREAGFEEVVLGEFVLRTETAGLIACQTLHLLNI